MIGCDEAVGRQLAGPVVRRHDDVGRVGRGNGAEVVADLAEVMDNDV